MKKTKYHPLDEISKKEFLKLFKGPLKKLLDYAKSQRIRVKPLREILDVADFRLRMYIEDRINQNIPLWVSWTRKRIVYVNIRDLELSNQKEISATAWAFAHEISHILTGFSLIPCPFDFEYEYDCPVSEYLCHQKGLELIKKLRIPVDEKVFWDCILRFVGIHRRWCPKFENCDYSNRKIKGKYRNKILFWQRQKETQGSRKILKKYLLI